MEFVHDFTRGEVTRAVNVIDGPDVPVQYGKAGELFKVRRVRLGFESSGAEWVCTSAVLTGFKLKKDGTESKVDHRRTDSRWDLQRGMRPWLDQLIGAVRPEGQLVLPFRLTGLESDELEVSGE